MNFTSMTLAENEQNIRAIRRFAQSKEISLQKVRNQDLWNLKDAQTGQFVRKNLSLSDAYEWICNYPY